MPEHFPSSSDPFEGVHPSRLLRQSAISVCALLMAMGLGAWSLWTDFLGTVPDIDWSTMQLQQSMRIVDAQDNELYRMYEEEDRTTLPTAAIPRIMKDAIIAIEDERFAERTWCIDVRSILRAAMANMLQGEKVQGGSTITQQLVRSLYLTPDKTYRRKMQELVLACRLERVLPKDDILTLYLNRVSFGGTVYGVEQAARTYLRKPARDLTLAEAALLAGIPQRPSTYNPQSPLLRSAIDHQLVRSLRSGVQLARPVSASEMRMGLLSRTVRTLRGTLHVDGRADAVLDAMLRLGYITAPQSAGAKEVLNTIAITPARQTVAAPHFVAWMREEAASLQHALDRPLSWSTAGARIETTLDPTLQWIAQETIRLGEPLLASADARNVALVAIDRCTTQVLAYVGNTDSPRAADTMMIDMIRAPRQPGSSFKPIVYAGLFERGYNSGTTLLDAPLQAAGFIAHNYDRTFRGWMSARRALGGSRNIPAIRALIAAGGEDVILRVADEAGAGTPLQYKTGRRAADSWFNFGWPLAIGSAEVPLLEMVQAYATIANQGLLRPITAIRRVGGNNGRTLYAPLPTRLTQALSARAAGEVDEILRDPLLRPQGLWRSILTIPGMESGVKTGTSNLCLARGTGGTCTLPKVHDVWTIGYNDRLVVGVWAGNADNAPLQDQADGLTVAAPLWRYFLENATPYAAQTCPPVVK